MSFSCMHHPWVSRLSRLGESDSVSMQTHMHLSCYCPLYLSCYCPLYLSCYCPFKEVLFVIGRVHGEGEAEEGPHG